MTVPEVSPAPTSRPWRVTLALLKRLPQAGLSRGLGRLADIPLPRPARAPILSAFARALGIDASEAEHPLSGYASLNDFFVRRLKEGARSWPREAGLASPVEGVVGQVGRVDRGRALQAKGRSYAVADLLADPSEASRYDGGWFLTLYLAPRHYHRIHAPVTGTIPAARYVPGALLPVNEPAIREVDGLFPRNERLVCPFDGEHGRVALTAVGAYNVGRISTAFDEEWSGDGRKPWVTNRKDGPPRERRYDPPVSVNRGDEVMAFHLGSTVVLFGEPDRLDLDPACRPGADVRLGQLLARPTAVDRERDEG